MTDHNDDIEYWKEYYLMYADTKQHKAKVSQAKDIAERFLDKKLNYAISFSGGKDSTVLSHLVNKLDNSIRFICQCDDMDFDSKRPFIDSFVIKYNLDLTTIEPDFSVYELFKKQDFTEQDFHSKGTNLSDISFYDLLNGFVKTNKITGQFWGLRAEESKARYMNYKMRGNTYFNNTSNTFICNPLSKLETKDIFAYLFSNKVPILDVYFKTKFVGSPENIRMSWYVPNYKGSQHGHYQWLKYYYSELFNKLATINPKIRYYV
jgi:3'-phosphoadenosine 5'-phosphosulfate sulfotransferase (PAPS reductase)/FAD synthetase